MKIPGEIRYEPPALGCQGLAVFYRTAGGRKEDMCAHGFQAIASTILNEQGCNRGWTER